MVNEASVKRYCKDYENIENYKEAMNDPTQVWHCHHRFETHFSDGTMRLIKTNITKEELIALDMYWYRPSEELIFMKPRDHFDLHKKFTRVDKKARRKEQYKKNKSICLKKQKVYDANHYDEKKIYSKVYMWGKNHNFPKDNICFPKGWNQDNINLYFSIIDKK